MEPIDWLVDKILPVGLSILGAPSKYYKSYMALGLCVAICQGAKFLGFDCTKHDCLYFDLESTKRRPKNRLDQIVGTRTKKPDNLHIITGDQSPGRIGEGFEEQVEYQLQKYPNIKLIVIDVFQLIRQPAKRNQTGYDRDYEDFRALKQIVDKHDIGVLLIHHTRKMKDPSDVFNELSGSTGMLGAQDCAWLISKKDRSDNEATLHITGRDLDNRDLKIEFDKKFFQWRYIGTEVHNFLESWGDDSKIGTLTMFYDREKELLVLNEDNDMYETCLMTATAYLSGDYERRKELLKNAPEGIVESVKLLEKVFKYRLFDKRTFQALNNLLDDTQRKYVAHLINEEDPISAVYIAFRAGMISGKRIERAKKRKDR